MAVHTRGLGRSFGSDLVLHDVDLDIAYGEILGIIGPSGCGKTTLIRALTGISPATEGEVRVLGHDPAHFPVETRLRLGYMPQLPVLYPELSVWSNLTFVASMYGVPLRHRRRNLSELLAFVDLENDKGKRLADCSGGMQRRLSLAATLVHGPELLLLDEPTAGIDPILRQRFWDRFRQLRDEGRTLIVSTQYVGEAASCDRVAVMAAGAVVTVDTPDGLRTAAFGGDVVDVVPDRGWVSWAELEQLRADDAVVSAELHDEGVRVVVRAGTDADDLRARLAAIGVEATRIEAAPPSFDEVFVALMARADAERTPA